VTRAEFSLLHPGDRVRLALTHPEGASVAGVVTATGVNGYAGPYAHVEWDDYARGDYARYTYATAADPDWLRRLHREDVP
jgi:hypothetical protein